MKAILVALFILILFSNNILANQRVPEAEYKAVVIKQHKNSLLTFAQTPIVISALIKANESNIDIVKIMQLDASWQLNRELQMSVMLNPLATKLIEYVKNPNLNIAEMMVLDRNGVLIAVFPKSTDYWQGDEDKFQQPIQINGDYIGPTKWDSSSQTYSFFYSLLIRDENQAIIGILATGLDVTKEYLDLQSTSDF